MSGRHNLDWSSPQYCRVCLRPLRSRRVKRADAPGTVAHHSNGRCEACATRGAARSKERAGRFPTARELAAAGHPCIEAAPMPSRERTYPL